MAPRSTKIVAASNRATRKVGQDSPMMVQFQRAKQEAPDALLFFRMGDFYELFHEDAVTASRALGLTLTARSKGSEAPIPMAGVPVKAAEGYLIKLVKLGHKVAVCEQLTDPKESKGIVERGIVRVVTPGTLTEEGALDARASNYLASVWLGKKGGGGLAWVDISTGRMYGTELAEHELSDELARLGPAELLVARTFFVDGREALEHEAREKLRISITERDPWRFDHDAMRRKLVGHFGVLNLAGFGIPDESPIVPAAGALLEYLEETQHSACEHVLRLEHVTRKSHLVLDRATRACLELVSTQRDGRRAGTLLDAIDATSTPMGSRLLYEWLMQPLREVGPILLRQRGVQELVDKPFVREEIRGKLDDVLDVERLVGRLATGRANGRDLVALARSLAVVPPLVAQLEGAYSEQLAALARELDPLDDVTERILSTLVDEPPIGLRDGALIRPGVDTELDELRTIAGDAKSWMAKFQAAEVERTGISGLKIGFNSVFGYFLEVPRGQVERVPDGYIRKQTIKAAERYITPELKEFEAKVLGSEELSTELEFKLFGELRLEIYAEVRRILETARAIAELDVLAGFAEIAASFRYVAPTIDESTTLSIVEGRHPVLERATNLDRFVPNDAELNTDARRLTILTGPNMAGKSTYIRQVALITLLAQIGSFVPAQSAHIGVVDRIFTRVGAGDDISRGESTFMVEMVEIANILNNASVKSLVILDEVGRGTSTFDGLALAWSIAEHLLEVVGCRALFATHYHQLTTLSQRFGGVANRNVAVREVGDEIVFLHKIVDGGTDRSYGIHVARLAGVPPSVLERARTILRDLENDGEDLAERVERHREPTAPGARSAPKQLALFAPEKSAVETALDALDLDGLTPIDALLLLRDWKQR
ncbi:MAG: DNA mismatch repair protein MutS [Planctomycetota bacterium]